MDFSSEKGKKKLIKRYTPKSKHFKNISFAFIFGGFLCGTGEGLRSLFLYLGIKEDVALTLVSLSLILVAALLTLFGVFDKIAKFAGAGTLVPITGFSNAVVSEAMDSKSEGFVLGVGSKIFTVAGPVILFGISSGIIYGLIYYIAKEIAKLV